VAQNLCIELHLGPYSICRATVEKIFVRLLQKRSKLNMQPFTAGIRSNYYDYDTTVLCLQNGLHRYYKEMCRNITGMWPSATGALMFFQVCMRILFANHLSIQN
jgi:hypothetical protein